MNFLEMGSDGLMELKRSARWLSAVLPVVLMVFLARTAQALELGNLPGNLANGGFVAGDGEHVFYVEDGLWRMDADGSNPVQLSDGDFESLNVYDGYLYYLKREDVQATVHEYTWNVRLSHEDLPEERYLRIVDGYTPYRMTVDGGEPQRLAETRTVADGLCAYSYLTVADGGIFYLSANEHSGSYSVHDGQAVYQRNNSVYRMDLDGGNEREIVPNIGNGRPLMAIGDDGKIHVVECYLIPNTDGRINGYLSCDLDGGQLNRHMRDALAEVWQNSDVVGVMPYGDKVYFSVASGGDGVYASIVAYDLITDEIVELDLPLLCDSKAVVDNDQIFYVSRSNYEEMVYEYIEIDAQSLGIWRAGLSGDDPQGVILGRWFLSDEGHPKDVQLCVWNGLVYVRAETWVYDDPNDRKVYSYSALQRADANGQAVAGGQPTDSADAASAHTAASTPRAGDNGYVLTTASVNMRHGPGLVFELAGTLPSGEYLPYLSKTSVDERGVAWYKVEHPRYGGVWISSRYSQLTENVS